MRVLNFMISCFEIRVLGPGVFFGRGGFLHSLALMELHLGDQFLDSVASSDVSDHPDVWTDGSFVLDQLSGVGVGGCGVCSLKSGAGWFGRGWRHLELLPPSDTWC